MDTFTFGRKISLHWKKLSPIEILGGSLICGKVSQRSFTSMNKNISNDGDDIILKRHSNGIMEIILNRPEKLNSLNFNMIRTLLNNVKTWTLPKASNGSSFIPNVVISSGSGGKAYCAGADVVSLYTKKVRQNEVKNFFLHEFLLDYLFAVMKPVHIAIMNGIVMGGGVGLSVHAPIRIATDASVFAMPEARLGLFPDVGATYFLPRIFNNEVTVGLYIALVGEKIKGKDLAQFGVATHYVPQKKIDELKSAIINNKKENLSLPELQNIVSRFAEITYSPQIFTFPKLEIIKQIFIPDSIENIFTRLTSLASSGNIEYKKWAQSTLEKMRTFSPLSMLIAVEQMKIGKSIQNLVDAYNIEVAIAYGIIEASEFFEGVRALLIDKDNKPNWKYKSYDQIEDKTKLLKTFFERENVINILDLYSQLMKNT